MTSITNFLKDNSDARYSEFITRLTPDSKYQALGVRVPILRKLASEILKSDECETFLAELPHTFREENLLHAFILEKYSRDYQQTMQKIIEFLPYADSWEITDSLPPKIFAKHTAEIYPQICDFLHSDNEFTVRFGIVCLMKFYLADRIFNCDILNQIMSVHSDKYYVRMAIAWFFSDALIKQYDATIPLFETGLSDTKLQNMAIKKAIESYRLSDATKNYLKNLKR